MSNVHPNYSLYIDFQKVYQDTAGKWFPWPQTQQENQLQKVIIFNCGCSSVRNYLLATSPLMESICILSSNLDIFALVFFSMSSLAFEISLRMSSFAFEISSWMKFLVFDISSHTKRSIAFFVSWNMASLWSESLLLMKTNSVFGDSSASLSWSLWSSPDNEIISSSLIIEPYKTFLYMIHLITVNKFLLSAFNWHGWRLGDEWGLLWSAPIFIPYSNSSLQIFSPYEIFLLVNCSSMLLYLYLTVILPCR